MTKTEAIAQLNALDDRDPEDGHRVADKILLDFLRDNGFSDVAAAFVDADSRIGFWYA